MATKPTKSKREKPNADSIFDDLVSNLADTKEAVSKSAREMMELAVALADSLKGTATGGDAHQALGDLKRNLKSIDTRHRTESKAISAETKNTLTAMRKAMRDALASERDRARRAAIKDEHERRIQDAALELQRRTAKLAEDTERRAQMVREATLDSLKELKNKSIASAIDEINRSITSLDDRSKLIDAAERGEEEKRKKKELTPEQRLRKELHELNKGYMRRFLVDPVTGMMLQKVKDVAGRIGDMTGISAVAHFVKGEKERRERRRDVMRELERMQIANLKATLEGKKELVEAQQDSTDAISRHTMKAVPELLKNGPKGGFLSRLFQRNTYHDIMGKAQTERQTRAIESLAAAARGKGKNGAGFGWADLLAISSGLLAGLGTMFDKWGLKNPIAMIQEGLSWLKGGSLKLWGEITNKLGNLWEATSKLMGENFSKMTAWMQENVVRRINQALTWLDELAGGWGKSLSNAGDWVAGKAKAVGSAVSSTVDDGVAAAGRSFTAMREFVSPYAQRGANMARSMAGGAKDMALGAGKAAMSAIDTAADWGKWGLGKVSSLATSLGQSRVGQFMGRNLNRLGNLGAAIGVVTGIAGEANGQKVTDISALDAILNPMDAGRFLGNKFNETFERRMGTSFGSWIYDLLNDDPAVAELRAVRGEETKMNAATVPAAQRPISSGGATSVVKVAPKQSASATSNLSARSIPDTAGFDSSLFAYNVGAII